MANTILAAPEQQHAQYHLPEAARAAILAQAPNPKGRAPRVGSSAQIDRQREAFMSANGGAPFGQHRPEDDGDE